MKWSDLFNFRMSEHGEKLKGEKTDEDLDVSLATDTLEDGTVLEYESLEVGQEVFVVVEGEDPKLASDKTYTLSSGKKIVVAEGKISEIMEKEEEKEEVEMSEEQKKSLAVALEFNIESLKEVVDTSKDGYHTVEFSIQDGQIVWGDVYSNTYKSLLSEQVDPIKTELKAEQTKSADLEAKIVVLQELADEKEKETNPIKKDVKLEDQNPLTAYEIQLGINK